MQEYFELASVIIASVGGAGAIIFGLSDWLGKVWATRLMASEKQKYAKDFESFKTEITAKAQIELERIKADVEIFKTKEIDGFKDKVNIYKQAIDMLSEALADLDYFHQNGWDDLKVKESKRDFNVIRLKNRGYMSMLSPPEIVYNFDALVDEIFAVYNKEKEYSWVAIRELSEPVIDSLRADIELSEGLIRYQGDR
jgi:hypothetical protein